MIGIRLAPESLPAGTTATEVWISDYEFELWVRSGQIGPDTMVWAGEQSGDEWRRAEDLEIYHLFQVEPKAELTREFSVRERLMPQRGFSAVEPGA